MYRWRQEEPEYWQPPADREDPKRGYLALKSHRDHPKQLVRHRSWVRPGVTFQVELFLDGVPEPELGALLWLLSRGEEAPLRLGAGKPYGFGVVATHLDLERPRLWDADGVRAGWLSLTRPDPVAKERLRELMHQFEKTARGNRVLHEAIESYLRASQPIDATTPVHYPRLTREPQAESYAWFVENERVKSGEIEAGWSLPHVRDKEQRLPYLTETSDTQKQDKNSNPPRNHQTSTRQSRAQQKRGPNPSRRSELRPDSGRSENSRKGGNNRRPS